ncbi:MAG: hypothetical protein PHV93_04400 [Candidatus Pacebacteria bacterium]|nr:hypothetical protein [Candidatus Paceibacterota bacterium]
MNTQEALQEYDMFLDSLAKWPKNQVWHEEGGGGDFLNFTFTSGRWSILVSLFVGPRGGLQQYIYVLDGAKSVAVEAVSGGAIADHDCNVLPIIDMRSEIGRVGKKAALVLFKKRLEIRMAELIKISQDGFLRMMRLIDFKTASITSLRLNGPKVVSGGMSGRGQSKPRRDTAAYHRNTPAHH